MDELSNLFAHPRMMSRAMRRSQSHVDDAFTARRPVDQAGGCCANGRLSRLGRRTKSGATFSVTGGDSAHFVS
jgi:hypothetical protein